MKHTVLLLACSALLAAFAVGRLHSSDSGVADARLVRAEVYLDGTLLLQASTSDDGHPNVDQVWGYLPGMIFKTTPEFDALLEAQEDKDAITLVGEDGAKTVELRIGYGGRAWLFELSLIRLEGEWRIPAELVSTQAKYRWIPRSAVDALREAERKERR